MAALGSKLRDLLRLHGERISTYNVLLRDGEDNIILAAGPTVPSNDTKGFSKGGLFVDTDVAKGTQGLYCNVGTKTQCTFDAVMPLTGVTLADIVQASNLTNQDAMTPAAGFAGTGTIFKTSVVKHGGIIKTEILIDLTGTKSSTTDLDIIGTSATLAAHIGQVTAAKNGTILYGQMTCFKTPVGGITDIDLYAATEATGKFDDAIAGLTETALLTKGGAWSGAVTPTILTALPAANAYLYLTGGAGGTAATYTDGRFLLELWGV
jgi:hypothetical protein